ncbi:MAG TPA: serine hydrolase domain-containing protein [Bauldia sp.]|nr:serine hydrolase domain-containing protein [Bauldia sp.]
MNAPARISARAARIDAVTDRALAEGRIVGSVILIAERGEIVYRRAAGYLDRETGIPMREDAIFRLASCTKPLVAATALAMADEGKLGLEDAVDRWLPDFRPRFAGAPATITIRHLLNHTSGFGYPVDEPGDPYRAVDMPAGLSLPGVGMEEMLRRLASVPLFHAPGTAWRYGMSIDVLGALIERANGSTLAKAVATHVTGPLGMHDTAFGVTDVARLAVPYADAKPRPIRMPDPYSVPMTAVNGGGTVFSPSRIFDPASFQSGGAGMAGTAGDFLRFLEALRTGGAPILKTETVALACRNQIGDLAREEKDAGWRFGYLSAVLDDPAAAHSPQSRGSLQWGGAYGHNWFIDPSAELSVAEFTNTAFEGCNGPFRDEIVAAVYG